MENKDKNNIDYYTIDTPKLIKKLQKSIWMIMICGILTAVICLIISVFVIEPKYSSNVKFYVDNISETDDNITPSDLNAAQSLVKTYSEILKTRKTLELIKEKSGVEYTIKDLQKMIKCTSTNGTEIMCITVETENATKSFEIAKAIEEILPIKVSEIIESSKIIPIDPPVLESEKISPNIPKNTLIAFFIGVASSVAVVCMISLLNGSLRKE